MSYKQPTQGITNGFASVTVVSAVRLWQLVLAERKPGFDPTCEKNLAARSSKELSADSFRI